MTRNFSLSQLTIVVGGTIVLGGLLILLIYVLHKAFQRQRSEADLKPASPRAKGLDRRAVYRPFPVARRFSLVPAGEFL